MNEGPTQNLSGGRSFEERVFARFDAMDVRFQAIDARFDTVDMRFDAIDTRFEKLEARVDAGFEGLDRRVQALEAKALDTKPIWERALAEILEVKRGVEDVNRKLDVLNHDVLQVRADQRLVHKRMDAVESGLQ
jgi:tetrahydromethanopterin S-methyltransferase subunit G